MFQHGLGIHMRCWTECSNILARFSVHAYLYVRRIFKRKQLFLNLMTKQRTYMYIISLVLFPKEQEYLREYLKMFCRSDRSAICL